jgi:hypothetical protein
VLAIPRRRRGRGFETYIARRPFALYLIRAGLLFIRAVPFPIREVRFSRGFDGVVREITSRVHWQKGSRTHPLAVQPDRPRDDVSHCL